MVQYIFTPWRNRAELLAVRRQFYPRETQPLQQHRREHSHGHDEGKEEQEEQRRRNTQQAVARVAMWMQRGGCPHMVESTALLTAAGLSDLGVSAGGGGGGEYGSGSGSGNHGVERAAGGYAVRAAYSAAFSRFVTGLLDSHQDKQRKMSMYDVAKSVGLPATFVELRHQATHEQLPSLPRLRAAAAKALAWIWEYYWRHLALDDAESCQAAPDVVVEGGGGQEGGEGDERSEEREVRELVVRYLEGDGEELKGEIGRADEGVVLTVLDSISGSTRDSRVLRRAMALTREILEGAERMEEDDEKPGMEASMDVGKVKAEVDKAREAVDEAEDPSMGPEDEDESVGVVMVEQRPAWALYEEEAWVPKPIGVV